MGVRNALAPTVIGQSRTPVSVVGLLGQMRQCLNPSKAHGDYNKCLSLLNRLEAMARAQPQSTDSVLLQPIGDLYQVLAHYEDNPHVVHLFNESDEANILNYIQASRLQPKCPLCRAHLTVDNFVSFSYEFFKLKTMIQNGRLGQNEPRNAIVDQCIRAMDPNAKVGDFKNYVDNLNNRLRSSIPNNSPEVPVSAENRLANQQETDGYLIVMFHCFIMSCKVIGFLCLCLIACDYPSDHIASTGHYLSMLSVSGSGLDVCFLTGLVGIGNSMDSLTERYDRCNVLSIGFSSISLFSLLIIHHPYDDEISQSLALVLLSISTAGQVGYRAGQCVKRQSSGHALIQEITV